MALEVFELLKELGEIPTKEELAYLCVVKLFEPVNLADIELGILIYKGFLLRSERRSL